jgi:hypothetical protein
LLPAVLVAAEVSGQVHGFDDGEPLAGVTILVMDRLGQAAVGTTDAQGSYRVQGIDPGLQRVRARPSADLNRIGAWYDDRYFFCGADLLQVGAADEVTGVDFELPAGGFIEGEVHGAGGPVAGATVTASGLDLFNASLQRSALTDELGGFRISGLDSVILGELPQPGSYRLSVKRAGEAALYFGDTWDADTSPVVLASRGQDTAASFQYPEAAAVRGLVLDSSGAAVAAAQVSLHLETSGGLRVATADAAGEFAFEDVFAGAVTLVAEAEGLARTWFPAAAVRSEAELVSLLPGQDVDLHLVLAPEARLSVAVAGLGEPGARLVVVDSDTGSQLSAVTLADEAEQQVELGSLPGRSVAVSVQPAGDSLLASPSSAAASLVMGESAAVSIALSPGAQLLASVRRRGGLPLRGAELLVTDANDSEVVLGSARSDGEGRFDVRGLPAGQDVRVRFALHTFCTGDPTSVERWWPEARSAPAAEVIRLEQGTTLDLGEVLLAPDADADRMDDIWEFAWGLNPHLADGGLDPDGDGLSNLEEYRGHSDPWDHPSGAAGCALSAHARLSPLAALSLLLGSICRIRVRRDRGCRIRHHEPRSEER